MKIEDAKKAGRLYEKLQEEIRKLDNLMRLYKEKPDLCVAIENKNTGIILRITDLSEPTKSEVLSALMSQVECDIEGIKSQITIL